MSLPISRKVEKAFKGWLASSLDITGMNYYEGHEKVDEIAFPNLVVYSESSAAHPDFPTECGVRIVRLRCKFTIDCVATERPDVDEWKQKLEAAMTDDLPSLQAALNRPPTGDDERAVKAIHFHYVAMTDDPSDRNQTDWIEDLVFDVTCELLDA